MFAQHLGDTPLYVALNYGESTQAGPHSALSAAEPYNQLSNGESADGWTSGGYAFYVQCNICIVAPWKHSMQLLAIAGSVVSAYPQTFFNEDAQAIVTGECKPAKKLGRLRVSSDATIPCCDAIRALLRCLPQHSMACTAADTVLQKSPALVCTPNPKP